MTTELLYAPLEASLLGPASSYIRETREALLAYETEELGALRLSIILTARWEASEDESPEQRAELRADLALLRRHYDDKIDEIAMTFGVTSAMKAKERVERTVTVPRDLRPFTLRDAQAELGSDELDETGFGL
ncbi:MAG: hypothetical protein ACRD3S_10965 [Terracidiphilus sp.]